MSVSEIIEILSPYERVGDVHRKGLDYLQAGTQEVWLLHEANGELFVQTPTSIRLYQASAHVETPLLPGFSISLKQLLA